MDNNLPKKILVVDNDEGAINSVEAHLVKFGTQISKAKDWQTALSTFNQTDFDLCIVSLKLDGMSGSTLIQKWRSHDVAAKRDTAFIVAFGQEVMKAEKSLLTEIGDTGSIIKPFTVPKLLSSINGAMEKQKTLFRLRDIEKNSIEPLLLSEKFDKAKELAKSQLEPLGERGVLSSSFVHVKSKDYNYAIQLMTESNKKNPSNVVYIHELGRIMRLLGKKEEALSYYEQADLLAPLNLLRVQEMSTLYLEFKKIDKALVKMNEVLALNPDKPDLKFDFYMQVFDAGFKDQAREFCKATSSVKELIKFYNNRGVALSKKGDFLNAIEEYEHASQLLPGSKELYKMLYNQAIAHVNLKTVDHLKKAHELLEMIIQMQPTYEKAKEKIIVVSKYLKK